ncbi:glycoside hydrolase family 3 N-terminal domain-containing protein [Paenibacillus guangzhouensis]|uniref:glycoside hydrolase family 3 N-terminal domain-containing protein n=1 Tax=Paenibacillus guangzhouensis TaxID=1473112 RepID=UPI001266AA32|nr:glycoside hydrolase family 3 N-terminal domain-containing protein [Paenibacillus guangzhouensis]
MWKRKLSVLSAGIMLSSSLSGTAVFANEGKNPTELAIYWNSSKAVEERVGDLLSRMSLDEKVGQMVQAERASVTPDDVQNYYLGSVLSGGGSFPNGKQSDSTRENWASLVDSYQSGALSTRLGIPILYGVDAIHGNSNLLGATLFPHNIALGATRDTEFVEQIGIAAAKEIKAAGTNWAFAPTIADPQNLQWGRSYEGFSDNQELVGEMGAAFIKGLQGATRDQLKRTDRVVATAKHFFGEGLTEDGVNQGNVTGMTEEQVTALDLPIYKAAIDAGARTVMASYSSIQGLKMHANKRLLTDVLKGDGEGKLGFTGFVISDYNAVQQITKDWDGKNVSGLKNQIRVAVNAGVDMLMMPTDWKATIMNLKALVAEGGISLERIDDAVTRILRVKFESGVFEHPMTDKKLAGMFGSAEHRELARKAVSESLVLLKNDKVNGSPILSQLSGMKKIFVAGKSASDIGLQSGGWSITWQGAKGNTTSGTTLLQGIQQAVGSTKKVTYNKHGRGAEGNDVAIAFIGETPYAESNGDGLNKLKLDSEDLATLDNIKSSGVPTIVVLVSGRPLMIGDRLNDWAGLVEAWLPGTEGEGVADVLFGDKDFTGKLPVRWPFYTEAYTNPVAGQSNLEPKYVLFNYGYGLTKAEETPTLPIMPDKPGPKDPYDKVEAENYTAKSDGLKSENSSDTGGGQDIGYTYGGAWLEYLIDVPVSGTYDIDFRYAGGDAGTTNSGILIIDASGHTLGELKGVGYTGGWQTWKTATVNGVHLEAGVQKIKMQFTNGGLNFNWFGSTGFGPAPQQGGNGGGAIIPQNPVPGGQGMVQSWLSSERSSQSMLWYYAPRWQPGDEVKQLTPQANLDLTSVGNDVYATTINIDPNKQYQTITGMGTSMEESTIFNITKMSDAKQNELLTKLVSNTNGIGMSMTRLTIGTADFTSRKFYSYDDMPAGQTDPNLAHFSIQKDIDYGIIPVLKKIIAINPEMKFFASPWSPPGWMKTTDSMIKGSVKDEYLPILADYYVKFIQAYKEQGINISAMTLQNEPLLEIEYPSTKMPWQQEAELGKLLHQKLTAAGLDVKLWIFDHNFSDTMNYPAPMLADASNRDAIDGTAFHDYGGDPSMMTKLHDLYPTENIYLTERAVWGTVGADRIAQYFRNWAKSYNSWVLMLDSDIATHQWVGTPDPTMVIQDSSNPDNYWLTPEYYLLGNYSKFVKPDYIRIDSSYGSKDHVTNVSFMSPDKKTIVSVVANQTDITQTFKLVSDGTQVAAQIPAKSVITYKWNRIVLDQKDPVVMAVTPESLPYNVDHKEISLSVTGMTYGTKLGTIKLGAEAAAMGITIGKVTYASPDQVNVQLRWDNTPYYVNTPLTVTASTYSDTEPSQTLIGSVMLRGTGHKTNATDILPGPVTANDYYQLSGVAINDADTSDAKLTGVDTGDWAEFKINVPASGKYAVTLKVTSPNGGGFLLQSENLSTLGSYAIPNLYGSTAWVGARLTVQLQAGEQIMRIQGNSGSFDMQNITFEPVITQTAGSDGVIKVEADKFVAAGQQVIQYGSTMNNLGYTVAGSTFDYLINVPQEGYYKVRLQYATPQGGVSASVLSNGTLKGSASIPSTGGWGNYQEAYVVVKLDAGVQTLRIMVNGDGFNFSALTIAPGTPEVVKQKAKAPLVTATNKLVALTTDIEGATIYYTIDGSLPTKDSVVYTAPIGATSAKVIRAITSKEGLIDSFVTFFSTSGTYVPVTGISLDPANLLLQVGSVGVLKTKFQPVNVSNEEVTWTSSDTGIAKVDHTGKVTAVGTGTATITVTTADGGHTATAVVTVTAVKVPVTGVSVTPTKVDLTVGGTQTLAATIAPAGATNQAVIWSSDKPGVAIVDSTTGKVTAIAVGTATIKVTTADGGKEATAVITVKATSNTGGGGESPGVSSPSTPSKPTTTSDSGKVIVQPITDANGVAVAIVKPEDIRAALHDATDHRITIVVKMAEGTKKVNLDIPAQNILTDSNIKAILLDTGLATVTINPELISKNGGTAASIIHLTVEAVDAANLPATVQGQLNGRTVYDFRLRIDEKKINNLIGSGVQIGIPYKMKAGEKSNNIIIYYKDSNGKLEVVKNGKYNSATGNVEFMAKRFSQYAAAYSHVSFTDTSVTAWAEDSIQALAVRGAINGTGNGLFNPTGKVTRAEFIKMLIDTFDLADVTAATTFTDVHEGQWYTNAVASAQKIGIVNGKNDFTFGVNDNITREEMTVMIYRISQQLNLTLATGHLSAAFTDQSQIAAYAKAAVDTIKSAGIINGMEDGSFAPKNHASRAQAATMIFRLFLQA